MSNKPLAEQMSEQAGEVSEMALKKGQLEDEISNALSSIDIIIKKGTLKEFETRLATILNGKKWELYT